MYKVLGLKLTVKVLNLAPGTLRLSCAPRLKSQVFYPDAEAGGLIRKLSSGYAC